MINLPGDSIVEVAAWNVKATPKQMLSVNLTPIETTNDQVIQLYMLLYPYIVSEFVHRDDLELWATQLKAEITAEFSKITSALTELAAHSHVASTPNTLPYVAAYNPVITPPIAMPKAFTTGEAKITAASEYSLTSLHRNPNIPPSQYVPVVDIVSIFKVAGKYVPFDALGDDLLTGDYMFINLGLGA